MTDFAGEPRKKTPFLNRLSIAPMLKRVSIWLGRDFKNLPEVQKVNAWFAELPIPEPVDCQLLFDESEKRFEATVKARQVIEDKADNLLKFNLAIVLAMLAFLKTHEKLDSSQIVFFVMVLVSSLLCFLVRMPATWPIPMDFFDMKKVKDYYLEVQSNDVVKADHMFRSKLAAAYHCASVGNLAMVDRRAYMVSWALVLLLFSPLAFTLYFTSPRAGSAEPAAKAVSLDHDRCCEPDL